MTATIKPVQNRHLPLMVSLASRMSTYSRNFAGCTQSEREKRTSSLPWLWSAVEYIDLCAEIKTKGKEGILRANRLMICGQVAEEWVERKEEEEAKE